MSQKRCKGNIFDFFVPYNGFIELNSAYLQIFNFLTQQKPAQWRDGE